MQKCKIIQSTVCFGSLLLSVSSCSTMSNREKTLSEMALAGIAGGVIGSAATPSGENSAAHAAMWAGISAAAAGAIGLYVNSDQRDIEEKSKQLVALQKELSAIKGEDAVSDHSPPLVNSRTALESSLPNEYRHLIRPGGWVLYKKNEWVQVSETEMVHQDKRLILNPPSLNFGKSDEQDSSRKN